MQYLAPLKALKSIFQLQALLRILAIFKLMSTLDSNIFLKSYSLVNLKILILSFFLSSNLELSISTLIWGIDSKFANSALILMKPLLVPDKLYSKRFRSIYLNLKISALAIIGNSFPYIMVSSTSFLLSSLLAIETTSSMVLLMLNSSSLTLNLFSEIL